MANHSIAWDVAAEAFANEVRHDAIPWAQKALDEVGAEKGPVIVARIRELASQRNRALDEVANVHRELTWAGVPQVNGMLAERVSLAMGKHGATPDPAAPPRLTENALNACKAFDAPTDPSEAVVYLATLLVERDAVREELRAIIVEAIKGAGEAR
jgi:hypothetical protein